jgi:hypothetical protein
MSIRKLFLTSIATAALALALNTSASLAANGDCGQPVSNGANPVATDCLFILQAGVGAQTCNPVCICDLNGSGGNPNATDALVCLNVSVGVPGLLNCDCGNGVVTKDKCSVGEFIALSGSDLDAGWNGAGHNANITEGASIFIEVVRRCGGDGDVCRVDADCAGETCDLTCDCDSSTNTECEVTGPVGESNCLVAMNKTCTTDSDCTAGEGTCVKFFGPPLPLSAEGTPTCVTTYFQEDISGFANTATGEGEASAFLRSRVHLGIQLAKPCPRCGDLAQNPEVGDAFTCDGGPRNGQACTVQAVSPEFGGSSKDCPPDATSNVSGQGLAINFRSVSTGTRAADAVLACGGSLAGLHPSNGGGVCLDTFAACSTNDDCLRCTGSPTTACASNTDCTGNGTCAASPEQPISCGVYCHCGFCDGDPDAPCFRDEECDPGETCEQGSGAVQQLQGNKCTDLSCGLGGPEECCSNDDPSCANPTPLVGECADQPYRGCQNNSDCTNAGASGPCNRFNRPCFENRISRTGTPSPLGSYCVADPDVGACTSNSDCGAGECVPDSSEPTTVALFCIPATASASINAAGGIPGPGAIAFNSAIISYRCGDGSQDGVEECDDGNNTNGDGCDEICRTE